MTVEDDELKAKIWYHGMITRIAAESMLIKDEEFLVRDSISSPGEYVLTTFSKGKCLHFQIHSVREEGKLMYQLEDELFSCVSDLISFYLSHHKPLTFSSGVCISYPHSHSSSTSSYSSSTSLSGELEASYMHLFINRPNAPAKSLSKQAILNNSQMKNLSTSYQTNINNNKVFVPPLSSNLKSRPLPLPINSPRNSNEDDDDYDEMDYDAMDSLLDTSSSSTFNIPERSSSTFSLASSSLGSRFASCQNLSSTSFRPPSSSSIRSQISTSTLTNPRRMMQRPALPPRPANLSSTSYHRQPISTPSTSKVDKEELRDSAFVDYDLPKSKVNDDYDTVRGENVRKIELDCTTMDNRLKERDSGIYNSSPSPPNNHSLPYSSPLLLQLRQLLIDRESEMIAESISLEDCRILSFLGLSEKSGIGASNGIRLILLPQGNSMRAELIERSRLLQLSCVLSIVGGGRKDASRILRQWILTARQLFSQGNLFSFGSILAALSSPMLKSIKWLWSSLDLQSTSESQILISTYTSLRTAHQNPPSKLLIPFLQPILEIFSSNDCQYIDKSSYSMEIESLWYWLDMAREWTRQADDYRLLGRSRYLRSVARLDRDLTVDGTNRLLLCSHDSQSSERYPIIVRSIQKLINDAT